MTEIRELLAAATPGPVSTDGYRMYFEDGSSWGEIKHDGMYPLKPSPADLELYVALRNTAELREAVVSAAEALQTAHGKLFVARCVTDVAGPEISSAYQEVVEAEEALWAALAALRAAEGASNG